MLFLIVLQLDIQYITNDRSGGIEFTKVLKNN